MKRGVLRLSVLDFDSIIDIYEASGKSLGLVQEMIVGEQNYDHNFHYVVFNKEYLNCKLERAGLSDVKKWTPRVSSLTTFDDWSNVEVSVDGIAYPISHNLESRK